MAIIIMDTSEEFNVPKSSPPLEIGLVKKSPIVAPKGLVNKNPIQKRNTLFILVK